MIRRVLAVDDDDDVLDVIAEILRDAGHAVTCAQTAGHALAELADGAFDVVLLDLTLPDLSGPQLLQRIPAQTGVAIVVLSGVDDVGAIGARHGLPVLKKPFGAGDLLRVVEG